MESAITVVLITAATALFGVFAKHRLDVWRDDKNERIKAAVAFRAAINPDFIGDFRGHALVNVLLGAAPGSGPRIEGVYFKHKRAVHEFRNYLGPVDRFRLNRAWKTYHGGNEECPNFLVLYGLPVNGHAILKHRLESLRNIGNQN